jgi:large subunit ribosomal protein L23
MAALRKSKETPVKTKAEPKDKKVAFKKVNSAGLLLVLKPRMSEKTYGLSQTQNTFVFDVPTTANKHEVATAVTAQYDVGVEDVRIVLVKGKIKASVRKRARTIGGKRSDIKKAYVRIKDGDSLPIFAAIEQEEAAEKKAEEKAAKKAKKESK